MIILFELDPSSVCSQVIIVDPSLLDQHLGREEWVKQKIKNKQKDKNKNYTRWVVENVTDFVLNILSLYYFSYLFNFFIKWNSHYFNLNKYFTVLDNICFYLKINFTFKNSRLWHNSWAHATDTNTCKRAIFPFAPQIIYVIARWLLRFAFI